MKLTLKILMGLVAVPAIAAIGVVAALFFNAEKPANPVGFAELKVQDPQDRALDVGIWYPTDSAPGPNLIGLSAEMVARNAPVVGGNLPLIVIPHGNGGYRRMGSPPETRAAALKYRLLNYEGR